MRDALRVPEVVGSVSAGVMPAEPRNKYSTPGGHGRPASAKRFRSENALFVSRFNTDSRHLQPEFFTNLDRFTLAVR